MWPRQDFNYYIIDKWTIIALDPNVFQNSTLESKIKGFVFSILNSSSRRQYQFLIMPARQHDTVTISWASGLERAEFLSNLSESVSS